MRKWVPGGRGIWEELPRAHRIPIQRGVGKERSCAEQREYHKQRQGGVESTECV